MGRAYEQIEEALAKEKISPEEEQALMNLFIKRARGSEFENIKFIWDKAGQAFQENEIPDTEVIDQILGEFQNIAGRPMCPISTPVQPDPRRPTTRVVRRNMIKIDYPLLRSRLTEFITESGGSCTRAEARDYFRPLGYTHIHLDSARSQLFKIGAILPKEVSGLGIWALA